MRRSLINRERRVLDQLGRPHCGYSDGDDLVVISMQNQSRQVDFLQVLALALAPETPQRFHISRFISAGDRHPGVIAVVLQWLVRFVVPWVMPETFANGYNLSSDRREFFRREFKDRRHVPFWDYKRMPFGNRAPVEERQRRLRFKENAFLRRITEWARWPVHAGQCMQ